VLILPLIVVVVSGILLQFKKQSGWIQPPTMKGSSRDLEISFERILDIARSVPEAAVESWDDVDRLDVRPGKGMVKVRCKNRIEIQIDTKTGDILQTAVRRSDVIESIHDGSYFHQRTKHWVFFPAALILAGLWGTGVYLFFRPYFSKRKRKAAV